MEMLNFAFFNLNYFAFKIEKQANYLISLEDELKKQELKLKK